MRVTTLGHGTLTADDFVGVLAGASIDAVVDVRRFPGSRRHPHMASAAMETWLPAHGVTYRWLEDLGGRRKPADASPNVGLRNPQFRAYADHMRSTGFRTGIDELLALAVRHSAAVMCSESVWWRCHRRLLADHLVLVEGVEVHHLFHDGRLVRHDPLPGATVQDGAVVYRAPG